MASELLTVPEVAAQLRVDPATVRRWITSGALTASKPGRDYRVLQADVDALVRRHVTTPLTMTTTGPNVVTA